MLTWRAGEFQTCICKEALHLFTALSFLSFSSLIFSWSYWPSPHLPLYWNSIMTNTLTRWFIWCPSDWNHPVIFLKSLFRSTLFNSTQIPATWNNTDIQRSPLYNSLGFTHTRKITLYHLITSQHGQGWPFPNVENISCPYNTSPQMSISFHF